MQYGIHFEEDDELNEMGKAFGPWVLLHIALVFYRIETCCFDMFFFFFNFGYQSTKGESSLYIVI